MKPRSYAAARCWWLAAASSSCSSRSRPHSFAMSAVCSPIERPVRGSALRGKSGTIWLGRNFVSALIRSVVERAAFASSRISRRSSLSAIGASEVVSEPPAIAESAWPSAILLATRIAASRPVPHAWPTSNAGVSGASFVPRTDSRVRLMSRACFKTAPAATSPRRSPSRPWFEARPSMTVVSMSWLEAFAYCAFERANGMRFPPRT